MKFEEWWLSPEDDHNLYMLNEVTKNYCRMTWQTAQDINEKEISELKDEVFYQRKSATEFCKQSQEKNDLILELKEIIKDLSGAITLYGHGSWTLGQEALLKHKDKLKEICG